MGQPPPNFVPEIKKEFEIMENQMNQQMNLRRSESKVMHPYQHYLVATKKKDTERLNLKNASSPRLHLRIHYVATEFVQGQKRYVRRLV
jgi:hypothetical protein